MRWEAAISCPAKINLHLEIGQVRYDGYHNLLSIFHMVDVCDTIWIRSLKKSDFCSISGDFPVSKEQNMVFRAVQSFRKATGLRDGFEIRLKKMIPLGAGLGGGSSDAAGTLRILNLLYNHVLTREILMDIGAELGSDVPFFLTAPAAFVSGRGEHVFPLSPKDELWCLLADSGIKIGTTEAYGWVDETGDLALRSDPETIIRTYTGERPERWGFFNSFEEPVFRREAGLESLKGRMMETQPLFTSLSGSGSVIYSLFDDREKALQAAEELKDEGVRISLVKMLARLPNAILQY